MITQKTLLHELYEDQKQSPWYDNLSRLVTDLKPLIVEKGIRGVMSNPTKAISSSNAYDDQVRELIKEGKGVEEAYWGLVVKDIQDACKLNFHDIYKESKGEDGYVSVEVSPKLAHETEEIIAAAKYLYKVVNQPDVHIKIPSIIECMCSSSQTCHFIRN
ncbi:hypothetical protein L7F22_030221 [Adiantum nelumboides]|nr:hypothetical protein [Adiantum nelumboides]